MAKKHKFSPGLTQPTSIGPMEPEDEINALIDIPAWLLPYLDKQKVLLLLVRWLMTRVEPDIAAKAQQVLGLIG